MSIIPRLKTQAIMVFYPGIMDNNTHSSRFNRTMASIAHLRALSREGRLKEAVNILLTTHNTPLDSQTYIQLLQTCIAKNALSEGKLIHSHINDTGFTYAIRTLLQNKLINMYDKCGSLIDARKVFDEMTERDASSWNTIIAAYRRHGLSQEALSLFHQMQRTGVQPDQFTFASMLPACAKVEALKEGMEIHKRIIECRFLSDVVVANALIDMYAKCGSMKKAHQLFDKTPQRNVVSWNAMIAGYAQNGVVEEALRLFNEMPQRDAITWNAMITAYAQHGVLDEALRLFKEMPQQNVVSWNAIITGYSQNELAEKALEIFQQMEPTGVQPNQFTFANILSACAKMEALKHGMDIHQRIIENGFLSDVVVANALIDMYAKCGSIQKAHRLFDKIPQRDAVTWVVMIAGFVQNGDLDEALRLFREMPQRNIVSGNIIIAGYAQIGVLDEALRLFMEMTERDTVSWTAMIAGYAQNGFVEKALDIFKQMQLAGVKPDSTTFASILPACGKFGALKQGMEIHQRIIESGLSSNVVVVTAMIDMYGKCGSIQKGQQLFYKMHNPNVVAWTAMISGYAMHGYGKDALKLFELMKHSGINPNHVSFVCVLFACSHAGLVDEGCKYFNSMSDSYCIMPAMDHYGCMVDLLGRAGYLEEALNFIVKMPLKPDAAVLMCLLGACRLHKNIRLGEFSATLLFELDPKNVAPYILLSNIYAEVGRGDDAQKIWKLMKIRGIEKIPGCSWIEVYKIVHTFRVGDRSHPQTQEIYAKLENLSWEMKAAGYIPDTKPIQNDVEEEEEKLLLCHHSEKLAIAFGLLNTTPGTTIRVVKNLRVCVDCHIATKFISKIVTREIVVRDANRFHHFKHGECSCGDYW